MNVTIRPENAGDAGKIRAVTEAAFAASPYGYNNEAGIVSALRQADALSLSLVAESAGMVVGHVAVSPVQISDGAQGWYGLGPMSVLPECQCQGVGTLLMRETLDELQQAGVSGCVLLGDPGYYGKFGFARVPGLVFPGAPAQYFLALKLCGQCPVGTVSYHEAFAAGA
ncbi:N-acetyltransferase [Marinobacter salinisoli]|uniref:N-acetyltransferase n=1 Tax=Marinobacter salinisoli TaxID=2769486 RepID=A0ABX7MU76_9GAMM|nr:N-acetyltransferase [Marinobacter salinisoli]QSP95000.1 N-acetyltransferase [Marinobacter salinisoli]